MKLYDPQANMLWYKDGNKLMFTVGAKEPPKGVNGNVFGTINDEGGIYLYRTCYRNHTYKHKKNDKFPGEESVSFSSFLIDNADQFGVNLLKLDVYTRSRGHLLVDIPVTEWKALACQRKFKHYETQSDVLVSDLFDYLVAKYRSH